MHTRSDKWNIIVEDKDKEFEYERIFARLLGDISRFKIIALGGKTQVIDNFTEKSTSISTAESLGEIYLLDGDFDFIEMNENALCHPSLIYLDRYDIENYLIDKEAIESFAQGAGKLRLEEVESHINFISWHQSVTQFLHELFILFYLVQKNNLGIKNVGMSTYYFFDDTGAPNKDRYIAYLSEVKECFENLPNFKSSKSFDAEINACKNIISEAVGEEFSRIISGKYYLLSIQLHLKNKNCYKTKVDNLRWSLITNFDIVQMDWLKQRIIQIVG